MEKVPTEEVLNSSALTRVLLCVVAGQNYSVVIARDLGYSQSAAVQNLKKMERLGLIKSGRLGGRVLYSPEWKIIASLWAEYVSELYLQEAEATSIAKNTNVKDKKQSIKKSLIELNAKPEFWKFTEAYFKALVQVEYDGSMQEAFALFAYDVPINERLQKLFKEHKYDFIEFIRPSRSFLGVRVAAGLEGEILDSRKER